MLRLKELREKRGLSVRALAKIAEVHYVSLVRLEGGAFDPRLSTVQKLARGLDVSYCELLGCKPKKGDKTHGTHKKKGRLVRRVSGHR